MKKIVIALLVLVVCFAAFEWAIQSRWGKEMIRNLLVESLEDTGFSVAIGKIEGTLPHAILLQNVKFESDEVTVSIDSLRVNLSLWGLINKELEFTEVDGQRITVMKVKSEEESPFTLKKKLPFAIQINHLKLEDLSLLDLFKINLEGRCSIQENGRLQLDASVKTQEEPLISSHFTLKINPRGKASIKGDFEMGKMGGSWTAQGNLKEASIKIATYSPKIDAFISLHKEEEKWAGKATLRSPSLLGFQSIGTNTEFIWDGKALQGDSVGSFEMFSKIWTGKTHFSWEKGGLLELPKWDIRSASIDANGSLAMSPDQKIEGKASVSIGNLQDLDPRSYGSLLLEAKLDRAEHLEIDGKASQFYWNNLFAESISFYTDIQDPFEKREGNIDLYIEELKWGSLFLDTATLEIASDEDKTYPFQLRAEGAWKHPLEIECRGFFEYLDHQFLSTLEEAKGSFFQHPLSLSHPVFVKVNPNLFQVPEFDLDVGDAHLFARIDRQKEEIQGQLILQQFPLDILSLNPLDLAVKGNTDIQIDIQETSNNCSADFKASIKDLQVASIDNIASGSLEGHFNKERLECKGELKSEKPLLSFNLSLPMHARIWPLEAHLLQNKNIKGDLLFQGKIEEILDFFDLGTHYLAADCTSDFHLSGNFSEPKLEGYCHFEHGYYENYFTGTQIKEIKADWRGDGKHLILDEMSGKDGLNKGQIAASGEIDLNLDSLFPFHFTIDLNRFTSVQIDLVSAEMNGQIAIDGNLKEAIATGKIEVVESDLLIPNRIPRSFPNLEVVYLNAVKPPPAPGTKETKSYPIHLNLSIDAPDAVFIEGRGLSSEWKGNFAIGGTNSAIGAMGKLELIKGKFVLSGRSFTLTEGTLSFRGKEAEVPYLNLAGAMDVKDISIIARLKGPLNDPQITLQSTPPLPLSTIMAYLLFGQNLAEINSYQALQLANSLASLAGQGPDVLENTRRALGVDKLNIVTTPSNNDELQDKIAVQVGKYISEGILLSLSQGAEDNSTNISIEIELKNGFVFQLESDQKQEQGKFTLKWNHNY